MFSPLAFFFAIASCIPLVAKLISRVSPLHWHASHAPSVMSQDTGVGVWVDVHSRVLPCRDSADGF